MKLLSSDDVCRKFGWRDYDHFEINLPNMDEDMIKMMEYILELHKDRELRAISRVALGDTMLEGLR